MWVFSGSKAKKRQPSFSSHGTPSGTRQGKGSMRKSGIFARGKIAWRHFLHVYESAGNILANDQFTFNTSISIYPSVYCSFNRLLLSPQVFVRKCECVCAHVRVHVCKCECMCECICMCASVCRCICIWVFGILRVCGQTHAWRSEDFQELVLISLYILETEFRSLGLAVSTLICWVILLAQHILLCLDYCFN